MSNVKTRVIRIGNSKGIRIPKTILDQYNIAEEVELEPKEDCLVIRPSYPARDGWSEAFTKMHDNRDDLLLPDDETPGRFDEEEWEW